MSQTAETSGEWQSPPAQSADSIDALCASHGPVDSGGRFQPGVVFGDWRLTAFIGRGGNGEVYCAEHVRLGTPAAVKVLVRVDERAKARFMRESKLLSELRSRSFPRFLSCGEANGREYLAMELLEPGELPVGDRKVARFLLQVCDAVSELHALGYVHRDIKPSNILWRGGTPVLADLGLVKRLPFSNSKLSTQNSQLQNSPVTLGGVGTPGYGAPEQMERGEASVASDIHSLGVLADRCFNGRPPSPWKRIIERATSSIPAHRYPSVVALSNAIRRRHLVFWLIGLAVPLVAAIVMWSGIRMASVTQNEQVSIPSTNQIQSADMVSVEPFPAEIQLERKTVVLREPVVLESGRVYRICGPGTLDADLYCPTTTVVRLKNCILLNRTKKPYPENGIQYQLENGVYLNFVNIRKKPPGISIQDFTGLYDGTFNTVRFGGPETMKGLREEARLEFEELEFGSGGILR